MFGTNIGLMELGIIALILLVLFGAKRIPLLLGSIGHGIRELRQSFRNDEADSRNPTEEQLPDGRDEHTR